MVIFMALTVVVVMLRIMIVDMVINKISKRHILLPKVEQCEKKGKEKCGVNLTLQANFVRLSQT